MQKVVVVIFKIFKGCSDQPTYNNLLEIVNNWYFTHFSLFEWSFVKIQWTKCTDSESLLIRKGCPAPCYCNLDSWNRNEFGTGIGIHAYLLSFTWGSLKVWAVKREEQVSLLGIPFTISKTQSIRNSRFLLLLSWVCQRAYKNNKHIIYMRLMSLRFLEWKHKRLSSSFDISAVAFSTESISLLRLSIGEGNRKMTKSFLPKSTVLNNLFSKLSIKVFMSIYVSGDSHHN